MMVIGHCLRFITYIGTTLPGSASHCMENMDLILTPKPQSLYEVFTRWPYDKRGPNTCGDLVFSGHVFHVWLSVLMIFKYSKAVFRLSDNGNKVLLFFTALLGIVQVPITLAARNHYTVDVVVASWATPLMWFWYSKQVLPKDMEVWKADSIVAKNYKCISHRKKHVETNNDFYIKQACSAN